MRRKSNRPVLRKKMRNPSVMATAKTTLASGPAREEISPLVLEILNRVANPGTLPVKDEAKNLTDDHGITDMGKETLAPSFSRISRDQYGGLPVSRADAKSCKLVGDAITLVWKRANHDATWRPK